MLWVIAANTVRLMAVNTLDGLNYTSHGSIAPTHSALHRCNQDNQMCVCGGVTTTGESGVWGCGKGGAMALPLKVCKHLMQSSGV